VSNSREIVAAPAIQLRAALTRIGSVVTDQGINPGLAGRIRLTTQPGLDRSLSKVIVESVDIEKTISCEVPGAETEVKGSWVLPFRPLLAAATVASASGREDAILQLSETRSRSRQVHITSQHVQPRIDSTLHVGTAIWPQYLARWGDAAHVADAPTLAAAIKQVLWAARRTAGAGEATIGLMPEPAREGAIGSGSENTYVSAVAIGSFAAAYSRFHLQSDPRKFPALVISPQAASLVADHVAAAESAELPIWTAINFAQFRVPSPRSGNPEITVRRLERPKPRFLPTVPRHPAARVDTATLKRGLAYLSSYLDFSNPDYSLLTLEITGNRVTFSASNPATGTCEFDLSAERGIISGDLEPVRLQIDPREVAAAVKSYHGESIAIVAAKDPRHHLLISGNNVNYYFGVSYRISKPPKRDYSQGVV